ncbi:unnamed protein product, partial [Strongylus vulgaris]
MNDSLMKNTSLFYGIPLKDLTPENVEIDEECRYSRRTMYRIRDTIPISISRSLFGLLERYRINSRDFKERNKESERMKEMRRKEIRGERLRKKLKSKVEEGPVKESKNIESNFNDCDPIRPQEWTPEEDWVPPVENEDVDDPPTYVEDSFLDVTFDPAEVIEPAENGLEAEDTSLQQQSKEDQPKSLICYEDFFI